MLEYESTDTKRKPLNLITRKSSKTNQYCFTIWLYAFLTFPTMTTVSLSYFYTSHCGHAAMRDYKWANETNSEVL